MRQLILLLMFLPSVAFAGTVKVNGVEYTYDDEYSLKDFSQRTLYNNSDLNGKVIYGSNFYQSGVDTHVFPDDMTGVTFLCNNLDNVYIPAGNTIVDGCGSRRRIMTQPDGTDWEVDSDNNPVRPL